MTKANVLIVGSGIAALQLAVTLRTDLNVMVLTKSSLIKSNSHMAQGGVAASLGTDDSPTLHYQDTVEAGRYFNDPAAVQDLTREGPEIIEELIKGGCPFDRCETGEIKLGMEGAHSAKRIVHSGGDATGRILIEHLVSQLGRNISVQENMFVYELLRSKAGRCIGVKAKRTDGKSEVFYADHVVLATGGCGQLYTYTSNAESVTGDGVALAYLAGAELVDMEFIQFHPTLLYGGGKTRGLISEAVRGEGAKLVTAEGKRIMEGVHPLKDLAPRHVVSQKIYEYLKMGKQVYLDITCITNFTERFPTVSALCRQAGVDLEIGKLPVAPGSHFLMGGVKTNSIGQTNIPGLYAIGEVACTGVHGANRLASNSLLEGMVYGKRLGAWLNEQPVESQIPSPVGRDYDQSKLFLLPDKTVLQQTMMDRAGIVRHHASLMMQKSWLESFQVEAWLDRSLDDCSPEELTKVFMLITAWVVTNAALSRTESRGGHFRSDYPVEDENWQNKRIAHKRKTIKDGRREQIKTALTT